MFCLKVTEIMLGWDTFLDERVVSWWSLDFVFYLFMYVHGDVRGQFSGARSFVPGTKLSLSDLVASIYQLSQTFMGME